MDRIKEHIYISNLLAKKSLQILTDEEEEALQTWLKKDPLHVTILADLEANLTTDLRKPAKDVDKEWAKFQSRNGIENTEVIKIKRLKWLKIVGSAAAAIVAAGFLWVSFTKQNQQTENQTITQAKESSIYKDHKGILLLSGGETKELGSNMHPDSSYNLSTLVDLKDTDLSDSEEDKLNTIVVPQGAEFKVKLPDGTIAWINAGSSLTFPTQFASNERKIAVKGEVCLDVAHRHEQPFIVQVNDQQIHVLGTLFNIEAYDGYVSKTTLVRGKIEVHTGNNTVLLQPNEQFVTQVNGQTFVRQVNASESMQWINGNFEFNDENIVDIMTKLSRWYDVSFSFVSNQKKKERFTLQVERKEALADVLRKLELTGSIRFQVKEKHILIY